MRKPVTIHHLLDFAPTESLRLGDDAVHSSLNDSVENKHINISKYEMLMSILKLMIKSYYFQTSKFRHFYN